MRYYNIKVQFAMPCLHSKITCMQWQGFLVGAGNVNQKPQSPFMRQFMPAETHSEHFFVIVKKLCRNVIASQQNYRSPIFIHCAKKWQKCHNKPLCCFFQPFVTLSGQVEKYDMSFLGLFSI